MKRLAFAVLEDENAECYSRQGLVMNPFAVILPDFLIIFLGLVLRARLRYDDAFWNAAERLVFKVLFPPLLFMSVAQSKLTPSSAALFLSVGVASMLLAVGASASL